MNPLYTAIERGSWLAQVEGLAEAVKCLREVVHKGRTIYSCGCGGSYAQALHFSGELISGMGRRDGVAMSAVTLGAEASALTAWSNDVGWEGAYARALRGSSPDDALVIFSTSGRSRSTILAAEAAQRNDMYVVSITGPDGFKGWADTRVIIPGFSTPVIQEHTLVVLHHIAANLEVA